jgi:site-specific recombinase XerD
MDRSTNAGRRDYTLLATIFSTGARVQEILDLRASDLQLTNPYQLQLVGKGRKARWCPLMETFDIGLGHTSADPRFFQMAVRSCAILR